MTVLQDNKRKEKVTTKLAEQFAGGSEPEKIILENLRGVGYEF